MDNNQLCFKKLDPAAQVPTRGSPDAAGLDMYSVEERIIAPGGRQMIKTGIAMSLPRGYVGLVCPRSGMAAKKGVTVLNAPGIADSDYRGELKVILINHSSNSEMIHVGDRIAQLVIQKVEMLEPNEVDELDDTVRGSSGFGSTGA